MIRDASIAKPHLELPAYLIQVTSTRNRSQSYHAQTALLFYLRPLRLDHPLRRLFRIVQVYRANFQSLKLL